MDEYYSVRLPNGTRCDAAAENSLELHVGNYAILKRDSSLEYVQLLRRYASMVPESEKGVPLARIQRCATLADRDTAAENEVQAKSAYRTACEMVEMMQLPMKLLNASYSFDRKLVTIQFTADGRVDFRELVKELSRALGTRLDLRQIGVRDETGICGGIAVCGQVLCCSRFLREFNSINVRMAKEQDLSLTPATISGVCGRLKCCLKYEHEGYVEMEKEMPRRGEVCECAKGRGRVTDRNMLTKKVTLALEEGGSVTVPVSELKFRNRSGRKLPEAGTEVPEAAVPETAENQENAKNFVENVAPEVEKTPVPEPPMKDKVVTEERSSGKRTEFHNRKKNNNRHNRKNNNNGRRRRDEERFNRNAYNADED